MADLTLAGLDARITVLERLANIPTTPTPAPTPAPTPTPLPTPVETAPNTVVTTPGQVIHASATPGQPGTGLDIMFTVDGKISVNGKVIGGANVNMLDYDDNHMTWQRNTSTNWYGPITAASTGNNAKDPRPGIVVTPQPAPSPTPPPTVGSAPPAAAAAGYNVRTLGPTILMGKNWFKNEPNAHITTNPDGSVTLAGPWDFNAQITSGDGHSFGIAFGGGGYFEWDLMWVNPFDASGGPPGWPAGWANSAEGRTIPAFPNWPNGSAGGGSAIEWDHFEFFGDGWGPTVWDWSVNGSIGTKFSQFGGAWNAQGNVKNNDTHSFQGVRHKIGTLWVPATDTAPGRTETYLDNVLQPAMTQRWNKWSPNIPVPLVNGRTANSIMDLQHFMMLAGSSTSNPMTLYGMSIWQKDGTANLPPS